MSDLECYQYPNLSGIPTDYAPVTADDAADNTGNACIGLYIQAAGNVAVQFKRNPSATRVIGVSAGTFLPGRISRVRSTSTTATGIFALQG